MSRCYSCNCILTPQESVRRFRESDAFTDLCSKCLRDVSVPTLEGQGYRECTDDWEEDDLIVENELDLGEEWDE